MSVQQFASSGMSGRYARRPRAIATQITRPEVAQLCYTTICPLVMEKAMTQGVKLRRAGGSIAATLPKDMADRLKLEAGDTVIAIETDRGILLTPR